MTITKETFINIAKDSPNPQMTLDIFMYNPQTYEFDKETIENLKEAIKEFNK